MGTGAQGLYRRGDPVLAVDKGELAVEVIESRELQETKREEVHWEFLGVRICPSRVLRAAWAGETGADRPGLGA